MNRLEKNALGRNVLPPSRVLALYDSIRPLLLDSAKKRELELLCESHERLRMELAGAMEMLEKCGGFTRWAGEPNKA